LRELVEEVALILRRIARLQQFDALAGSAKPRVMAVAMKSADSVRAWSRNARNLISLLHSTSGFGVRPGRVLAQELREDALAILGGEVDRLELDADHVRDGRGVDEIGARRAVFVGVVVLPVLHEEADHLEALRFSIHAATDESTPPDMPTITRALRVITTP
jgi:hypothetical protein